MRTRARRATCNQHRRRRRCTLLARCTNTYTHAAIYRLSVVGRRPHIDIDNAGDRNDDVSRTVFKFWFECERGETADTSFTPQAATTTKVLQLLHALFVAARCACVCV